MTKSPFSSTRKFTYVIVGGGLAGGFAVREFISRGLEGKNQLCLISGESLPPYCRPQIAKTVMQGKTEIKDIFVGFCLDDPQTEEWYKKNNISLFLNTKVTSIDASSLRLATSSGMKIKATKAIILATGSRPIYLPVYSPGPSQPLQEDQTTTNPQQIQGLHHIYSSCDWDRLRDELEGEPKRVLVVGASYLGVEITSSLAVSGHHLELTSTGNQIMPHVLSPSLAQFFEEEVTRNNVILHKNIRALGVIEQDGRAIGCRFDDGQVIRADVVIATIGLRPNTDLLVGQVDMQTNCKFPRIMVDPTFETSQKGIFAIGDIAGMPFGQFGNSQLQLALHARTSAEYVVKNLMEEIKSVVYDYTPQFKSILFHHVTILIGDPVGDTSVVVGAAGEKVIGIWAWENRILAILIMRQRGDDCKVAMRAVKTQMTIKTRKLRKMTKADEVIDYLRSQQASS